MCILIGICKLGIIKNQVQPSMLIVRGNAPFGQIKNFTDIYFYSISFLGTTGGYFLFYYLQLFLKMRCQPVCFMLAIISEDLFLFLL